MCLDSLKRNEAAKFIEEDKTGSWALSSGQKK